MLPFVHTSQPASEVGETKSKQTRADQARKRAKKERLEKALDEALEATFPASDPVAVIEPARERPGFKLDNLPRATLRVFHGQHPTLSRIRSLLTGRGRSLKNSLRFHLEPRWAGACGAWTAALLAVLIGLADWRVAVMIAATAFVLARAGDMLDSN